MFFKNLYSDLKSVLLERENIPEITTVEVGWGKSLGIGYGVARQPMYVGAILFTDGWGDHADSKHIVRVPGRAVKFEAQLGLTSNPDGRIVYSLEDMEGNVLAKSDVIPCLDDPVPFSAELPACSEFVIRTTADGASETAWTYANVVWGEVRVTLDDGRVLRSNEFRSNRFPINTFDYDGLPFHAAVSTMTLVSDTPDFQKIITEETTADGALTLRTTITAYKDFPVIEWLPELLNTSDKPSRIVSNFKSLDLDLDLEKDTYGYTKMQSGFSAHYLPAGVTLRRTFGSQSQQSDFVTERVMLRPRYPEDHIRMDANEARSSGTWLPYFGIDETEEQGVNLAVGWSGEWCADFYTSSHNINVQAGMPETHFRVLPGETLRQVSMLLHHRDGLSVADGMNQFRHFMLKYHTPRHADGTVMDVPISYSTWGGDKTEKHLKYLDMLAREKPGYDIYWIDAGWYGPDRPVSESEFVQSDWALHVGNWAINHGAHPEGFKPIGEAARKAGLKFMLWFEIERVMRQTPVAQEHPEWILMPRNVSPSTRLLLNFGIPEAVDWALEQVRTMFREHGLEYYRQDFNLNPRDHWRDNDAPDRVGVNEMKHIAGLYRFWDTLLAEYPGLLIDNCASGGRRLDFEACSRSICLWRSDMLGRPWYDASETNQVMSDSLACWVPLQSGGTTIADRDDYAMFSGMITGGSTYSFEDKYDIDMDWLRRSLATVKRTRKYYKGNWYSLTEHPEIHRNIYAYQCDLPECGEGYFAAFRRPRGDESCRILSLQKIDPAARYEIEIWNGETKQLTGAELQNYRVEMPSPRSVQLVFYRKLD